MLRVTRGHQPGHSREPLVAIKGLPERQVPVTGVSAHLKVPSISCNPTPPNACPQQTKGCWKSSHVGHPRTHKLGTKHRGHGSCSPFLTGQGHCPHTACRLSPNPQPEPTGSELPNPTPAFPHSRDSAGPDVQPCVGSSHYHLPPQQEATPGPQQSPGQLSAPLTSQPLLSCLTPPSPPSKRTYTRPLEEILPG